MEIKNNEAFSDAIPEGYRIVRSPMLGCWYYVDTLFSDVSDDTYETPQEALIALQKELYEFAEEETTKELSSVQPISKLDKRTWEEKQAEAKRKREQANKEVMRNYRIK